jgi:hypothetical protein
MKFLVMKFSPHPRYLVPLRPKCSPQHPIIILVRTILLAHFSVNSILIVKARIYNKCNSQSRLRCLCFLTVLQNELVT